MLALMVGLGTTAQACNADDCPGILSGQSGEIFVHYQDDIYLQFDDNRDSLAGFDADYDMYDVYIMDNGKLYNANTYDEYVGAFSTAIWYFSGDVFPGLGYTCHLDTEIANTLIGKSLRLAWNRRFDWEVLWDWAQNLSGEYQSADNSPIVIQYDNGGQWITIDSATYLCNSKIAERLSDPRNARVFARTVPELLSNGQYMPYGVVMTDKMAFGISQWEISSTISKVDTGLPSSGASDKFDDASGKLDNANKDIADKMPDVAQDDIEGLYPDVGKLDANVLYNVHILTNGIYSNVNIVSLLSTGVGLAIIGYLLFGKKE